MTTETGASLRLPDLHVRRNDPALSRIAADGSLELLFQPEVDLASGDLVALEGLLRWHHGDLGVLAPADFLGAAEHAGYSRVIADWVLATGAAEVEAWQHLPRGSARCNQLWLNVAADQLSAPDFLDRITFELAAHNLPDGVLGLEVTQAVVEGLGSALTPLFAGLRRAGIALAVDHVSAWTVGLATLPLEAIKLSHDLVRGIDTADPAPVQGIITAAHRRGLRVVAEGVETWEVAHRLSDLGCDRAYGWLFSSPQRSDKARWLMTQGPGWRGTVVSPDPAPMPQPRRS